MIENTNTTIAIRKFAIPSNAKMAEFFLSIYYVGKRDLSLTQLLQEALNHLPPTGMIERQADLAAIIAISWLIDQVPPNDPIRPEIERKFLEAISRRGKPLRTRPIIEYT